MTSSARYRIAVLASGRGSNLQALIDAIAAGALEAEIVGVFSDKAQARALRRARAAGIATSALDPAEFAHRAAFDEALFDQVEACRPDLIVCAGYLRLIEANVIDTRVGRVINIHPSLLPHFKGLRTHRQALEAAVAEHGASVHFVTPDLDGGPVIAQARILVLSDDTAETLAARVLEREHPLLVESLRWLAAGRIVLTKGAVHVDGVSRHTPLQLGANNRFA
ncbi:MAG: phosphoribosylglycinamide formyltransferase [Luteimonas sp.]